jgi:hypothetical protein
LARIGEIPPKTPQKLKSEFREDFPKLVFPFPGPLAEHSVSWQRAPYTDAVKFCRLYPALCPDVRSDVNASEDNRSRNVGEGLALALLWCAWQAIRLPLLGVLLILEPVVRLVLSAFALVITLTAFFFEFTSTRPFPFLGVLAVGLAAFALLALYEALIQFLRAVDGRRG